jgi:gluconate kinase
MNRNLLTSQLESLEEPKNGIIVDISNPPEVIVGTIIENLKCSFSSRS